MFEEYSWVDAPDCVFPNTCDRNSMQEVSSLASENNGTLHHCFKRKNMDSIDSEFCQNGSFLDNNKPAVGENSCTFPLGPSFLADDDLSFFDNNRVDKDVNDLLYYSWSEIGDFEDVDMMFSCDSTFGLGDVNEDDLGWFSSSDAIKGSGEGFSDFKFQNLASNALENISGRLEVSRTKETGCSVSDSGTKNQSASSNLWPSQKDESANPSHPSFVNGSSNSECNLVPQKKLDIRTKLCIRDSLYWLARSAELRHRDASNDYGDDRDRSQALISERTNKGKDIWTWKETQTL